MGLGFRVCVGLGSSESSGLASEVLYDHGGACTEWY